MDYIKISSNKRIDFSSILLVILFFIFLLIGILMLVHLTKTTVVIALLSIITVSLYFTQNAFSRFMVTWYSTLLVILYEGGWLGFNFPVQAQILLEANSDVTYWFGINHPHAIRLLVAYPGYLISKFLEIELNSGFAYYSILMYVLMYLVIMNTVMRLENHKKNLTMPLKMFLCLVPFSILPFIMNGRLILAYFGFTIIINLFVGLYNGQGMGKMKILVTGTSGFLLTTVSSGTMTVAMLYIMLLTYILNSSRINKNTPIKKITFIFLLLSPVIYRILQYVWFMFMRNVNFFGGGISGFLNMFNHGIGQFLVMTKFQIIISLLFIFIIVLLNIRFLRKLIIMKHKLLPIVCAINIALYGLIFGYSTGSMMLPPLIILVLILIKTLGR